MESSVADPHPPGSETFYLSGSIMTWIRVRNYQGLGLLELKFCEKDTIFGLMGLILSLIKNELHFVYLDDVKDENLAKNFFKYFNKFLIFLDS